MPGARAAPGRTRCPGKGCLAEGSAWSAPTTRSSWMPRALARCAAAALYAGQDLRLASSLGGGRGAGHAPGAPAGRCLPRCSPCMISAALAGRSREQVLAGGRGNDRDAAEARRCWQLAASWRRPPVRAQRPARRDTAGPGPRRPRVRAKRRISRSGFRAWLRSRSVDRDAACAAYGALAGAWYGEVAIAPGAAALRCADWTPRNCEAHWPTALQSAAMQFR